MEKKRIGLLYGITVLVALSALLGVMISVPQPVTNVYGQYIRHGGAFCVQLNKWTPDGYIQGEEECSHNTLMNAGANLTLDLLTGRTGSTNVSWIAIGNGTDPTATSTTLNMERAENGLARALGTLTVITTGAIQNMSYNKVFTYTGTASQIVNTSALFNASSGGVMFIGNHFTDRTMQTNDQLNITAYFWTS